MNRRKCRRLLMILSGALLMLAALLLAFRNLWEERRAGCEAERVLTALRAALPETARQEDMVTLTVTDAAGNAVDWPMDASGAPMAWPLDGDGQPVAGMTDAAGRTVRWPAADGGRWTVTAAGLLPWATGSDGVTAQWPLNLRGLPCTLAELRAEWTRLTAGMRDLLAQPDFVLNPGKEMPTVSVDGSDCIGVLEVPALELSLPVMSGWSYPKLRIAPCRFEGSAYSGDLIVAGHNYARHFGGLKRLSAGDEVRFTDAAGNVFVYAVLRVDTLSGGDADGMRAGEWDLTLFTCTYGGRSRVAVRCGLEKVVPAA